MIYITAWQNSRTNWLSDLIRFGHLDPSWVVWRCLATGAFAIGNDWEPEFLNTYINTGTVGDWQADLH